MTHLRKMMLEELQRRNYSKHTAEAYIRALRDFAAYYNLPPDRLQPEQIRSDQLHLMREKGLAPKSVIQKLAAMKFFYSNVLRRSFCWNELPYPKTKNPLPIILSQDEIKRIIDAASDLFQRAILMTLYSTGIRCEELAHLTIGDIDSKRMMVRIHRGKGGKDRDVPLSPKLLETLREYWRWMKPQTYLFPSRYKSRKGSHITTKGIFDICRSAAQKAGIQKTVGCHTFRHCFATHLLEAGADLLTIQLLLGHASIKSTVIYLHLSQRHLRAFPNPLDALAVSDVANVKRSGRKQPK
jgi:integrase/recombinase XerD